MPNGRPLNPCRVCRKKHRPLGVQLDRDRDTRDHQRRQEQTSAVTRHDDVDYAFHHLFGRRQRRALQFDRDRIADIAVGPLKKLRECAERHERHGQRKHAQPLGDRTEVRHALGIDEKNDLLDLRGPTHRDDVVDHFVGDGLARRHMKMGHDMIAVARQVLHETLWNCRLRSDADDRPPAQRSALERARQRDPPESSVREQCDSADRPKHQNVAARQVVADAPREDAGGQESEKRRTRRSARCAPGRP